MLRDLSAAYGGFTIDAAKAMGRGASGAGHSQGWRVCHVSLGSGRTLAQSLTLPSADPALPTRGARLRQTPVRLAAALLLALLAVGCAPPGEERSPTLLAGVAASLQPVAAELAMQFEAAYGTNVTLIAGASGVLAEQLRRGARMDILILADSRHADALIADGLIDPASAIALASGELAAITNLEGPADAAALLTSGAVRHLALANPEVAPYGEAARRYLQDEGLWRAASERAVYGESVAQAFQFVVSGNAELGFVARSLLLATDARNVRALAPLPPDASDGLLVAAGVSAETAQAEEARRFIGFMHSSQSLETWRRFGYTPYDSEAGGAE